MAAASVSNFVVQSRFAGRVAGAYNGASSNTLGFQAGSPFRPGDEVLVSLTSALAPAGGGTLANPASWSFRVRAGVGPGDFTQQSLAFGAGTDSIAGVQLGDLDGDGDLDIFASYTDQAGRVWINQGGGSFASGPAFGSAALVGRCVALGDFDGDGDLDIVQGSQSGLRIYTFNGSNFVTGQVLSATANVPNLEVADFDADGDLDVIAAKLSSGGEVFLNNGAASFTSAGSFGGGQIVDVAVADFDGDLRPDIVLANASNNSIVYLNSGGGTFTASSMSLGSYTQMYAVCAANIDGDSDVDVVGVASGNAYIFKLNSGILTQAGTIPLGSGDYEPHLADVDGDANVDLVIAVQQGQSRVYMNDGAGNFTAGSLLGTNNNGNLSLAVGDVDGDNDLDVVFACANQHQSSVLLNGTTSTPSGFNPALVSLNPPADGLGASRSANVLATFVGNSSGASASSFVAHGGLTGRLNGAYSGKGTPTLTFDPAQDFSAGEVVQVTLSGGISTPLGPFTPPTTYQFRASASAGPLVFTPPHAFGNTGWGARSISAGDIDHDGDLDLVALFDDQPCLVLLNAGNGRFVTSGTFGPGFNDNRALALGDMDGDGDLDAVVARGTGITPGETNTVYFNNGAGVFGSATDFGPGNNRSACLALGDMDGDGDLDVVVGNLGPCAVYFNNGSGQFGAGVAFGSSGFQTSELALADFNRDGFLDAACANHMLSSGAQDFVHLNDGTGALTLARPLGPAGTFSEHLAVGDMDGDGDPDAVVCTTTSVTLWLNNGLASFTAGSSQAISTDSRTIALGDIDGDGDLDIALGPCSPDGARIIRNSGGAFGANLILTGPLAQWDCLCMADLDGDDDLDFAAASIFSSTGVQTIYHELVAQEAALGAGPAAEIAVFSSIVSTPVQFLDFTLSDPGTNDALPTRVTGFTVSVAGSSANANDGVWTLNGPDASGVVALVQGALGSQQLLFSNLAIEISGGTLETYTISFAVAQVALGSADHGQFVLSLGTSQLVVPPLSSTFVASTSVGNPGAELAVVASKLSMLSQPGSTQAPGAGFNVLVGYTDANGNVDSDVQTDVLSATRSDSGVVSQGTVTVANGLASFTGANQVVLGSPEAIGIHLVFTDNAGGSANLSTVPVQSSNFNLYLDTADSTLSAGTAAEPVSIDSVIGAAGFVPVLDVLISDAGGDNHPTTVSQLEVDLLGSAASGTDGTWRLDGAGVTGSVGVVSGAVGAQKITFSALALSVADGTSATITLSLRLNTIAVSTQDMDAWQIRVYTTGLTLAVSSTSFAPAQPAVGNYPTGLTYSVLATELRVTQQPPASVNVGTNFDVSLEFTDAAGNRDSDINGDVVTVARSDGQPVTGITSVIAAFGRVWFTGSNALWLAAPGAGSLSLTFTDDAAGLDLSASPVTCQSFALVAPGGGSAGSDEEQSGCTAFEAASPLAFILLALLALLKFRSRRVTC